MEKGIKALGDLVKFTKYSKWIEEEKRRETWEEMCYRNMEMHLKKFKYVDETDFTESNKNIMKLLNGLEC